MNSILLVLQFVVVWLINTIKNENRASRQDMAAVASPQMATSPTGGIGAHGDHHTTLMEDPDVWRPT